MRLGIDATTVLSGRTGGIETYAVELVRALCALAPQHVFVLFGEPALHAAIGARANLQLVPPPVTARSLGEAFATELGWLPGAARRQGVALVHHLKNYACAVAMPSVLTLHDMFPEYLLRHEPGHYSFANAARTALMTASARLVDRVITVSASAAQQIARVTGVARDRLHVTPLAPKRMDGDGDASRSLALPSGYLLVVGKTAPYKNLPRLLRAYLGTTVQRRLVVVGGEAFLGGAVAGEVRALAARSQGRIVLTGWVTNAALSALYSQARALVFPSLIEGFGLPPLEAASLGVPVALSDIDVHREVMGDAALHFDPHDEASIGAALQRLDIDDVMCERLGREGRARATLYSWAETARRTLTVYEQLLGGAAPLAADRPSYRSA